MRTYTIPSLLASLSLLIGACNLNDSSDDDDADGANGKNGGVNSPQNPGGGGGDSGNPGHNPGGSGGGQNQARALSPTTLLFERRVAADQEHIVAIDYLTKEQWVISTLEENNVPGWTVDGMAISRDRTRIVFSSMVGASSADAATMMAAQRIWSMNIDGQDWIRLTPVFKSNGTTSKIDVRNPSFSPDGQTVVYDYGEYAGGSWYVAPFLVASDGSATPALVPTNLNCSINGYGAYNPVTGDLLLKHSVCVPGSPSGLYLYPKDGSAPIQLVDGNSLELTSERPVFTTDGAGILFTAQPSPGKESSLYIYLMKDQKVVRLLEGEAGIWVVNAAVAPDDRHIVVCLRENGNTNLWLWDVGVDPTTFEPLTQDQISCNPVF